MEEDKDYLSDISRDSFESFSHHIEDTYVEQRWQDHVISINIKGGGGGEDDEDDDEEEGGGGNDGGHHYKNNGDCHHFMRNTKCIFRVPKHIREVDERAYTPQCVSIGPFHYGHRKLSFMESHKKSLLASMRWDPDRRSSLRMAMLELEVKARSCYSKQFNNIDSHTFGEMMLTDAFFIIQLFLAYDIWCKVRCLIGYTTA